MAMVQQDALARAVMLDMIRQSDLLKIVPIDDVNGFKITQTLYGTLPTVTTRAVGGTWTHNEGHFKQKQETLTIMGGEFEVDRILTFDKTVIEDPLISQAKMKALALTNAFNNMFINGNQATTPNSFDGLAARVANAPAAYTIQPGGTSSDAYKILADAAHINAFIDALNEAIDLTQANCLLMNRTTKMAISAVLRRSGLLNFSKDNYDRQWSDYMGAKLIDVGLLTNESTEIITLTEEPGDSGADATSIYAVRFDGDDGLHAIQLAGTSPAPIDPTNGGELETAPAFMRRIDWGIGLRCFGKQPIARIYRFKPAAA
jgi:hypothetical protein